MIGRASKRRLALFIEAGVHDGDNELRVQVRLKNCCAFEPRAGAGCGVVRRASAQHLRDIAPWWPDLRYAMPEMWDTWRTEARSDIHSDTVLLGSFVSRSRRNPAPRNDHAQLLADARKLLARLDSHEDLAKEDEAALSGLGP